MSAFGLWFCRHDWHKLMEPGNCTRCGYRYHGGHRRPYATWRNISGGESVSREARDVELRMLRSSGNVSRVAPVPSSPSEDDAA